MATWTIFKKLNVSPASFPTVIHIKQYSSDFILKFQLYSTDGDLYIEAGATTRIRGTKRDGNGFELTGTRIGRTCTFSGTKEQMQQMTAAHGRCVFEVVVEHDGKELITANFYLEVQRAAMDAGTVTSESIINEFADFQSKITAAQAAATAAQEQADRAEAAAESIDFGIDSTLTQSGQAADAKAVGDEVTALKQDIINGRISIGAGTEDIVPSTSEFQVARITPKNGNITENRETYLVIDDVNTTYYPLFSTDFLADNIKAIQGAYSDVYFVLFCYDKTTSEYLGAIFQEYTFKSKADLEANNRLYPYNSVDMDTLRTMFPDYKYKLEITDASVNHDTLPTVSDILDWCTYTVPRATSQRQLVKTVNGASPDSSGNVTVEITTDSAPTQGSTNPISSGGVWTLKEELTSADDAEVYSFFWFGHEGYYINTSGQITERAGTDWGYTEDYYPVEASTEYHLKITDTVFVAEYASDESFIKCASITASVAKFTTTATTAYIRISAKSADWDMLMSTADFFGNYRLSMLRDAWTRKIEEDVKPISDTVLYTLLDFGHAGSYINTSGQIVSASEVWGYTDTYYPVDASTEYFLKITDTVFVAEYASDKSFIKCASISVATAKFTTTATTAFIRISAKNPDWIPLIVSTTAFFGNYDMALINDAIERKTSGIDVGEIDKIKNATVLTLFGFGHQGYYINTSGNVVSTNQTWGYTEDYYPVNPATEYFLKTTDIVFIAEYTSDKTFIKCASIAASVAKFTSTANTAYVRIDAKVTDWATFAMSTTSFFGNYDTTYIDSAIDRKTGAITKGNLYGKKIVFFGDSITGNYKPPADYPSFIAQATGATVYNAGFGGTCMCDNGETKGIFSFCRLIDAIVDGDWTAQDNSGFVRNYFDDATEENYVPAKIAMLKAINWAEIDYVMTNHGTNDWGSGYTIDNANNLYDKTTYAGAFRYAFEKLQTAYPNIKIIPITPLTRISHEGSVYYDSNEYDRGTGQYLYQFANKIIDVAENKYFTRPCDLYHSCMITKWNHTRYLRDGIHPTTTGGQEWVAQLMVAFFNSYI